MKKNIYFIIAFLLISTGLFAQIDRSHPPKPGPSPKISLDNPKEFKLSNGLEVLVVENHKLPKVTYSLRLDRVPVTEGKKAGVSGLLGSLLGNGTTSIPKDKFNEEVDFLGAYIGFSDNGAIASSLTQYSDKILELMADATMHPLFSEEEFNKDKEKMIQGLKSSEKNVNTIASRVGRALVFGVHHPFGEFITEESLNNITFDDVKALYKSNFHPAKAYLVVVGDVEFNKVKKSVEKYFKNWKKGDLKNVKVPEALPNVAKTEIDFVDVPNAVQSNISLTNKIVLHKKDPDYYAALMANEILGGGFNGYLNMNLREKHGYTYGSYSYINDSRYVARFRTTAKVRNAVTDSAVVETIKEIKRIRTEPVDADLLKNTKAKYTGNFVLALENPQTIAEFAMDIKTLNLPADYYTNYLKNINAVSVSDVKRAANKFFLVDHARIIVAGKGSEVLKNLEKTGLPIKYYDKYANPVKKPDYNSAVPAGITGKTVIQNYLKAIGGIENINKMKSIFVKAEATIQGMQLTMIIKKMNGNKFLQEMSAMGNVMNKTVVNGNSGYVEAQGRKKEFSADELKKFEDNLALIPELSLLKKDLKVEGIEDVDGEKAYKLKLSDERSSYYSVKTGLKLKDVQVNKNGAVESFYKDYKEVKGVKFPFILSQSMGPQKFDFIVKEIKVNEGVTDADFK
ncbi:MAG: insulinase family protein [Flavobacteriia bacterium]|nr:MAG: insulinase family protein [Flavobacteriia bacterium]